MPGAPPSASTSSPESSAMAAQPGDGAPRNSAAAAACLAFKRAFSRKLAPVSSGEAMPSSPRLRISKGRSASNARNSRSLPGVPVATMSGLRGTCTELVGMQARDARCSEVQQLFELVAAERVALGGALHLDEG